MLVLNKDYKKIDHPKYKYELIRDIDYTVPKTLDWVKFRHHIYGHPVHHEYISIHIRDNMDIIMRLKNGYRSDGASGPTWDTPNTFNGAYGHDAGYQSLRLGLLPQWCKRDFDKWLRILLLADGMHPYRAAGFYYGVHYFGASSCRLITVK